MNIRKILSLIVVFGFGLILSGCVNPQGGQVGEKGLDTAQIKESANGTGTAVLANSTSETTEPEALPEEDLLKLQSRLNEIVSGGDLSKCKELTAEPYFVTCEVNIMSALAKSATDTQVCDKASNENIKKRCVAQVKLITK